MNNRKRIVMHSIFLMSLKPLLPVFERQSVILSQLLLTAVLAVHIPTFNDRHLYVTTPTEIELLYSYTIFCSKAHDLNSLTTIWFASPLTKTDYCLTSEHFFNTFFPKRIVCPDGVQLWCLVRMKCSVSG